LIVRRRPDAERRPKLLEPRFVDVRHRDMFGSHNAAFNHSADNNAAHFPPPITATFFPVNMFSSDLRVMAFYMHFFAAFCQYNSWERAILPLHSNLLL
jgi:hypothetical protein